MYSEKFEHLRLRHNIIWQMLSNGIIQIILSKNNFIDSFIKGLSRERIDYALRKNGFKS